MRLDAWTPAYRRWIRRLLVRLRGDRCQRCRADRPRPLCLRVPPSVMVPAPTPDAAELLCGGCCREADAAVLRHPAVLRRKAADRANGLADRDALHRWADDGGRAV